MKKVLMITYYWPPLAGAGAQRIFSFGRYLSEFDYQPLILTRADPSSTPASKIPQGRLFTAAGWDPASYLKKKSATGGINAPTANRLAEWVRLNIFVPDTKTGWFKPAFRKACRIIEDEKPDVIFTSAPPYTVHLVGKALKKRYGTPWVADFRDPWLENHAYNTAHRTALSLWINRRLESAVLSQADHITTALESQRDLLASKTNRSAKAFTTIHNGFEHSDWTNVETLRKTHKFYLSHFGTVYRNGLDNAFFQAIAHAVNSDGRLQKDFVLRLYGSMPSSTQTLLRDELDEANLQISASVEHAVVQQMLQEQQLLLLIVNGGQSHVYSHPSKVFEYMASGNPIIAVGPKQHEVMTLLREHAGARAFICDTADKVAKVIETIVDQWRHNRLPQKPTVDDFFSRQTLTQRLAEVFDSAVLSKRSAR